MIDGRRTAQRQMKTEHLLPAALVSWAGVSGAADRSRRSTWLSLSTNYSSGSLNKSDRLLSNRCLSLEEASSFAASRLNRLVSAALASNATHDSNFRRSHRSAVDCFFC